MWNPPKKRMFELCSFDRLWLSSSIEWTSGWTYLNDLPNMRIYNISSMHFPHHGLFWRYQITSQGELHIIFPFHHPGFPWKYEDFPYNSPYGNQIYVDFPYEDIPRNLGPPGVLCELIGNVPTWEPVSHQRWKPTNHRLPNPRKNVTKWKWGNGNRKIYGNGNGMGIFAILWANYENIMGNQLNYI